MRRTVTLGTALATAGTAHAVVNARSLRLPTLAAAMPPVAVSVLLPVRNEAHQVAECLATLCAQPVDEILVMDDGSSDDTAQIVRQIAERDSRVRLLQCDEPPPGWLGKPHACAALAAAADPASQVLVFVDADVRLAPRAVPAAVDLLLQSGLDLVSPYPRQISESPAERLVQPLLQWSWLTFLPLRRAEQSGRPSLTAANGQFLVVRRAAYERCGGHSAVADAVLDDVALMRAIKKIGGRGGVVDGTLLATCRMYRGWDELRDGYRKSLWSAFGSDVGGVGVVALLFLAYVLPALAALRGSRTGLVGYLAGVAGRLVAARATGGRKWPDVLAHPASVTVLGWLTARSIVGHHRGTLQWKGRPV